MSKMVALLFFLLGAQTAIAHSWVLNAPIWSRSYAEAQVPGDQEITDTGVTFAQTTADANAANATANASAHAHSIGLWGGNVKTTAFGPGAWAGSQNPFNDPINPTGGSGAAEMTYAAVHTESSFTLSGTSSHDDNGYLELAVLDISGMSPDYVSGIFLTYGSVESALTAGYLDEQRVLFRRREGDIGSSFSYQVDVGTLYNDDIMISGLSHAAAVPEPSSLALLGLGVAGLFAGARRRSGTRMRG